MGNQKIQLMVSCTNNIALTILDLFIKTLLLTMMSLSYMENEDNPCIAIFLVVFLFTFVLKTICETHIYIQNNKLYLEYAFCTEPPIEIDIDKCLVKKEGACLFWEIDGDKYITNDPVEMKQL